MHELKKRIKQLQLSMKAKLVLGFAVILIIVAGVSTFHLNQVDLIKQQNTYQNDQLDKQKLALELKIIVNELDAIKSGFMISKKPELVERYATFQEEFYKLVKQIAATASNADERKWSAKLTNTSTEYTATFAQAVAIANNKTLSPIELISQLEKTHDLSQVHKEYIFELVDNFNKAFTSDAAKAIEDSNGLLNDTANVALWALIGVIVITIGTAIILIKSFVKPINRLQQAVQSIANGDLRHKINSKSKDELGTLSNSFDHMIDQVRSMLAHTQTIASSLSEHSKGFQDFSGSTASANAEILRAIQDISSGAEQQALQSEQSTHIIADLEQEIELISGYTQTVQHKSREAAFNTHTGSASMEALMQASKISENVLDKVYQAMSSLSSSSTQINKIVNTISEISQQTNVLALNAAIEAARAGVHGRGFSVIAEEVRQLSTQTNESSKSIAVIIRSLLKQTNELELHMDDARESFLQQNGKMSESIEAFHQIRGSMDALSLDINQIHAQIAFAQQKNELLVHSVQIVAAIAQETAAGVQEVNSTSTLQNAAIQQVASQADDIMLLSEKLFHEVSKFQIGDISIEETSMDEELNKSDIKNEWVETESASSAVNVGMDMDASRESDIDKNMSVDLDRDANRIKHEPKLEMELEPDAATAATKEKEEEKKLQPIG
ncbi:methyl-accepting chemotaxis protein [Paenibacillus agricola]|uniref:Methyl-accepting chemotaxis protein n=1 Tax=Paenibacillus agricola TaxID=2716264 RepID=A0ABX0J508_9BACL|nr:methyl-accepting chemotaxis protein [Paenibacillus agricola]NHN31400.1 methyl-accepting chemotaxis protein [Paenibacillus agricola]